MCFGVISPRYIGSTLRATPIGGQKYSHTLNRTVETTRVTARMNYWNTPKVPTSRLYLSAVYLPCDAAVQFIKAVIQKL